MTERMVRAFGGPKDGELLPFNGTGVWHVPIPVPNTVAQPTLIDWTAVRDSDRRADWRRYGERCTYRAEKFRFAVPTASWWHGASHIMWDVVFYLAPGYTTGKVIDTVNALRHITYAMAGVPFGAHVAEVA